LLYAPSNVSSPPGLLADHPLEAQLGEGVAIGGTLVTSAVASEVVLLRMASGLRYMGMLRLAAGTSRLTWASSEAELLGARAAWQEYRALPLGKALTNTTIPNLGADFIAQGGANYLGSSSQGWERVTDSVYGVNLIETGMAVYGLRPVGIGVGSALFQYSLKDGFQSPLNQRLTWTAFGAQAIIGTVGGYSGDGAKKLIGQKLLSTYRSYQRLAWNVGHEVAYPVVLGGYRSLQFAVPNAIGITEETLENKAQDRWPIPELPAAPDSLATPFSKP
jgi:hypothetical protein